MASQSENASIGESLLEASVEQRRANTLEQGNPYALPLTVAQAQDLETALSGALHGVVGFLVGAVTIPEPLPWHECLENFRSDAIDALVDQASNELDLDQDELGDLDDEEAVEEEAVEEELDDDDEQQQDESPLSSEQERSLEALFEHVKLRVAAGEVASLIPIAQDTAACDAWIQSFEFTTTNNLHDPTDEEAQICFRVFARPHIVDPEVEGSREAQEALARATLAADVTRLIELWSEVPPYDPETDTFSIARREPVAQSNLASERVIHQGGTYVRSEVKVGRNDLCPCGSGKKYKKCCG